MGLLLHVHEFGSPDGAPVLFLHPANVAGHIWRGPVENLGEIRALCPDLPGFGRSVDIPMEGFDAVADLVAETLVERNAPPLPVIGYSYGSYVGFRLAQRHPTRVARLMFISGQITEIKGAWWMGPMTRAMAPFLASEKARRKGFKRLGIEPGSPWLPDDLGACSWRALSRVATAALKFEARDAAKALTCPVLAIAGDREHSAILETMALFDAEVPQAAARLAPGGHAWPATSPDLFTATVTAFLHPVLKWSLKYRVPWRYVTPRRHTFCLWWPSRVFRADCQSRTQMCSFHRYRTNWTRLEGSRNSPAALERAGRADNGRSLRASEKNGDESRAYQRAKGRR